MTQDQINAEYTTLAAKAGDIEFQLLVLQGRKAEIMQQLKNLTNLAASLHAAKQKEAQENAQKLAALKQAEALNVQDKEKKV